ncbi:hypothetical protein FRB98_000750 [Tulasnella sp. 332]|nr:hypothetical protein FRB98_000750 [Tulasnella sp. 332]
MGKKVIKAGSGVARPAKDLRDCSWGGGTAEANDVISPPPDLYDSPVIVQAQASRVMITKYPDLQTPKTIASSLGEPSYVSTPRYQAEPPPMCNPISPYHEVSPALSFAQPVPRAQSIVSEEDEPVRRRHRLQSPEIVARSPSPAVFPCDHDFLGRQQFIERKPLAPSCASPAFASPVSVCRTVSPTPTWTRHHKWGRTNDISLIVQDTLYEVPAKLLEGSSYFTSEIENSGPGPMVLEGVTISEMDDLLFAIDAPAIGKTLGVLNLSAWSAILRLATKWGFTVVRDHAITVFDNQFHDQDALSRLDLARECGVAQWFQPVYRQLCERRESLSFAEAEKLGLPQFVAICRIRDELSRLKLENMVRCVDVRLNQEEVSLNGRCDNSQCRMKIKVSGKPYEGMDLCRWELEKGSADAATCVVDLVADAHELQFGVQEGAN